jgi:hypothetical protein
MARELRIEELSVVAATWSLKLKPAKLRGVPLDKRFTRYTFTHFGSRS